MTRYNIMAAKPYTDKQSNEQKTKWVKLGSIVIMQDSQTGKQKMFGDLDCIPAGAWFDGSIQLFEADQQQSGGQQQQGQGQQQGGYNQQQTGGGYNQQGGGYAQ